MSSSSPPSTLKETFTKQGYIILNDLIPQPHLPALLSASSRTITKTRSGKWAYRRTVGKQFPPFDTDTDTGNPELGWDSWGVQHVMHRDLDEPSFARWYTCDELIDVVKVLLDCEEGHLQMELFNLLINPESHEFALRWHRDDVREDATEEEEIEALARWHHGVQWNTALYEDACLYVVPGSHAKPRTPEQRALSETLDPPQNPLDMPGAIQVVLKPGQTVFYNSNILHCATYSPHSQRAMLHACIGDIRGGSTRARNVLQHGLKWMREDRFKESLPEGRARDMLERLLEMETRVGNGDGKIEYSLSG